MTTYKLPKSYSNSWPNLGTTKVNLTWDKLPGSIVTQWLALVPLRIIRDRLHAEFYNDAKVIKEHAINLQKIHWDRPV